jgi:hypothetical protein
VLVREGRQARLETMTRWSRRSRSDRLETIKKATLTWGNTLAIEHPFD